MALTKDVVGGLRLRDIKPISVRCDQYPSLSKSLMRLISVMEFPSTTGVLSKREVIKRNVPKEGREAGLQSDPQWIVWTDEYTYCRDT